MQKKIIALAIAAAISAPAFADTSNVTVYGVADVSYDMINTGTSQNATPATAAGAAAVAANTAGAKSNRVSSNSSRLGLKGSEDLGDGLSAVWQVESLINIGNASGTPNNATQTFQLGNRNTFAGLSSATAGTVLMGRHDTPYKIATRAYDQFADGIADNRSIMGGQAAAFTTAAARATGSVAAAFDNRQDQVVAYISPKLGGIATLAAAYVNLAPTNSLATSNKASATSLAAMFDVAGGFSGALAYESHDLGALALAGTVPAATLAAGSKESATKLGLAYTQDVFNVNFAYEKTKDNFATGANALGHADYYLSGKYNFGSNAVKAAYTRANSLASDASSTTGAKQFSLGFDHSMSKRTTVYALYTKIRNDAGASYTLSSNSSVGGASTIAGNGASPSALAFGMKHTF